MPVILLAIFIDLVGFGMIIPILPFLAMTYGGDATVGTALMSIYALAAFAIGPIWGRISDKFGRKPTLAVTFLGAAGAYILLAFSSTLWMVFLARAISGAMTGNVGIVMAVMADTSDEQNRGKAMGQIGAAFGLGFAFGPGIGGYLANIGGETSVFLPGMLACGLSLLAMVLTLIYVPETNPQDSAPDGVESDDPNQQEPDRSWISIVTTGNRAPLFVMFVIMSIGQSISFSISPFWAEAVLNWTAKEVGILLMSVGFLVFILQYWGIGPLFKKLGEARTLQYAAIAHISGCIIIIFAPPSIWTAATAFPLVMGALTVSYPALNSILSIRTDRRIQGAALGLSNGFASLGRIAGPITAGILFTKSLPWLPFVVVALVGLVTFAWATQQTNRQSNPSAS